MVPGNLRYTKTHEWAMADGDTVTVGISKFAADQLTDITYIDLPAVGKKVTAGATCGNVETVKAVSDLYSPIDGDVTAVNSGLTADAGPLTADPYGAGWLFKLRVAGPDTLSKLLTPEEYQKQLESEAH
ncbi:MAG: glycine cleavage system protein GcvH [Gemmataceae bacterium]